MIIGDVLLKEGDECRKGFACCFVFVCGVCSAEFTWYSSPRSGGSKTAFDANEISTLAFRFDGNGHSSQAKWAEVLNTPPPADRKCIKTHTERFREAAEEEMRASIARAAAEVRGSAEVADIAVSFDGSWSQRGYTVTFGFGSVIANDTGTVVDCYVASKACQESWDRKDPEHESAEWQAWKAKHDEHCTLNHVGPSKAMEAEIAKVLWTRSQDEHSVRYTTFVGDGDGSASGRVRAAKPYGESTVIEKEDCIGHVQKRMGSKLREVKRSYQRRKLSDGHGIGGRGRLTTAKINSFQVFYGRALRSNVGSVKAASDAVMAIFLHSISTDDAPNFTCALTMQTHGVAFTKQRGTTPSFTTSHPCRQLSQRLLNLFLRNCCPSLSSSAGQEG